MRRWNPASQGMAVLALVLVSCFGPEYPVGIPCSEAQTCPPGQVCDPFDAVCRIDPLADPCTGNPCDARGTCVREDADGYRCACEPGYEDDGTTCVDIDECAVAVDPCAPGGVCVNGDNAYACDCAAKFTFDGNTCVQTTFALTGDGTLDSPRQWEDGTTADSCHDYLTPAATGYVYEGSTGDGIYLIQPPAASAPVPVFCDMTTDGGGWTAIEPTVAAALGGTVEAVRAEGPGIVCRLDATGLLDAYYTGGGGTRVMVCQYDIDLGFAFDTLRLSSAAGETLELLAVTSPGHTTDISNLLGQPWGENVVAGGRGDVVIGAAVATGPSLGLGEALGLTGTAVVEYPDGTVIPWPRDQVAATPLGTVLRIQLSESGSQDEGYRWQAGRVYVRRSAR